MEAVKIIAKGALRTPSYKGGCVSAKQYIIIEENGEKKLLLRFANTHGERADEIEVEIEKLGEKGELLSCDTVTLKDVDGAPKSTFALERKLPLPKDCASCRVRVLSARCGDYVYTPGRKRVNVSYSPVSWREAAESVAVDRSAAGKKGITLAPRSLKMPGVIMAITMIMLILTLAVFVAYALIYPATHDSFLYGGVRYTLSSDAEDCDIYVSGFNGRRAEMVIPESIEGHKVRAVNARAFSDNKYVKKITIEGSIDIDIGAFGGCTSLKEINLEKVTAVGENAFYGCISLESVKLDSAKRVGKNAFYGCNALSSVTAAKSEEELDIGATAFGGCGSLKTADFNRPTKLVYGRNASFADSFSVETLHMTSFDSAYSSVGISALFGADSSSAESVAGKMSLAVLTIDEMKNIPAMFAANTPVREVTVGKLGEPRIESGAFLNCTSLVSLALPVNAAYVGESAFEGAKLTHFNGSELTYIGARAFKDCASLTTFVPSLKEELSDLGEEAFSGCKSLTSFAVPAGVTELKTGVLSGCSSLTNVTFAGGDNLTKIGEAAFKDCSSLARFAFPVSVTEIGKSAFEGCVRLWDFAFPDRLVTIGASAFKDCTMLSSLTVPDTVISLGLGSFGGCVNLTEITVPFIGGSASANTYISYIFGASTPSQTGAVPTSLKKITVTSIEAIPASAFAGCNSLERVDFGKSITSIGNYAFRDCLSLYEIDLPSSLAHVGEYAFSGCTDLQTLTVPDSVVGMGKGIFSGCDSLRELTLPFVGSTASDRSSLAFLFGSDNYSETAAVPLSLSKVHVTKADSISAYAFYGLNGLKEVVLDKVETVGEMAFANCRGLNGITAPATLKSIGYNAFDGCYFLYEVNNLSSLDIKAGDDGNGKIAYYALTVHSRATDRLATFNFGGFDFVVDDFGNAYLIGITEVNRRIDFPANVTDGLVGYGTYRIWHHLTEGNVTVTGMGIPADVSEVGEHAFTDMPALETVTFETGSAIRSLNAEVFAGCKSLVSVRLPDRAESIGDRAFYDCAALESVVIPDSVTFLGDSAFYGCTSLLSATLSRRMTTVGYATFYGCEKLKSITVGPNALDVAPYAFYFCDKLRNIDGLEQAGVRSVGECAFMYCSSLGKMYLSESLNFIGDYAFGGCAKLYEVWNLSELPIIAGSSSYGSVAASAFVVHTSLSESLPRVERGDAIYLNMNGWRLVDYYGEDETFTLSPLSTVSGTVNNITVWEYTFTGNDTLKEFKAENVDLTLPKNSFYGCHAIETVNLDTLSAYINSEAFSGCESLKNVTVAAQRKVSASSSGNIGTVHLSRNSFAGCGALVNMTLSGTVVYVEEYVVPIYGIGLKTLDIEAGGSITLENYAFGSGMFKLESLRIVGEGDIDIGFGAFSDCAALPSLTVSGDNVRVNSYAFRGLTSMKRLNITAKGALEIGSEAFASCASLETLDIKAHSLRVMERAFYGCSSLKSLALPDGTTYIGERAFMDCVSLSSLSLGTSLEDIAESAFENCRSLVSLNLPEGLLSLGYRAFYGCSSLKELSVPSSLRIIGSYAFSGCNMLKTLTLSEGLDTVGAYAFNGCSSLETLTLPAGLTEIESGAFYDCSALTTLNLPDSLKTVDGGAFSSCISLKRLEFGSGLTYIGSQAFANCRSLETLTFSEGLTQIGFGAFQNAAALAVLNLPDTLETINTRAFYNASNLQTVEMPASLTEIGDFAFYNANKLRSITLPEKLQQIGDNAFMDCTSLFSVYNRSSLTVRPQTYDFGGVGYYALVVSAVEAQTRLNYAEYSGIKLVYSPVEGLWFVYGYDTGNSGFIQTLYLPEKLSLGGEEISSYGIKSFAFGTYDFDAIVIPKALSKVQQYGFMRNLGTVYYGGKDYDEWAKFIESNNLSYDMFGGIYFYNGCTEAVHIGCWQYDSNGKVNTQWSSLENFEIIKEPSCAEYGESRAVCEKCGYTETRSVERTEHKFGKEGFCLNCGLTVIGKDNLDSNPYTKNDADNPFKVNNAGVIYSTNKADDSSSSITVTATENIFVELEWMMSSEMGFDKLVVVYDNSTVLEDSGDNGWRQSAAFFVEKGKSLTVSYVKDGSNSSGDDCIYIYNLTVRPEAFTPIAEEDEPQTDKGEANA